MKNLSFGVRFYLTLIISLLFFEIWMGTIRNIVYPNINTVTVSAMNVMSLLSYKVIALVIAIYGSKILYTRASKAFYLLYCSGLIIFGVHICWSIYLAVSFLKGLSDSDIQHAIGWTFLVPLSIALGPCLFLYQRQILMDTLRFRLKKFGKGGSARFGGIGTFKRFPNQMKQRILRSFFFTNSFGVTCGNSVFLGRTTWSDDPFPRYVFAKNKAHSLVIAGPRSGKKTCSVLIENSMREVDTIFIGDPKGELTNETFIRNSCKASLEARGINDYNTNHHFDNGFTFVLDAFDESNFGGDTHTLIGAEVFTLNDPNADVYIEAVTDGMVKPESEKNKVFEDFGRKVVRGVIVHRKSVYPPEYHTLPAVRDFILGIDEHGRANPQKLKSNIAELLANDSYDGSAQEAGKLLNESSEDLKGSIMSTVMRAISWVNHPKMRAHLSGVSSFDYRDIGNTTYVDENGEERKAKHTIYIVLSDMLMKKYGQWLRCHAALSTAQLRTREKLTPCHVVIDEFPKLAQIEQIKEGFSISAGFNIQYTLYLQNLTQLISTYKEDWQLFFSGTNVRFFGVDDLKTAKFISDWVGMRINKRERTNPSMIENNRIENERNALVITPQEVLSMLGKDSKYMLYFDADGALPIKLERLTYKPLEIVKGGRMFNSIGLGGLKGHFEDY